MGMKPSLIEATGMVPVSNNRLALALSGTRPQSKQPGQIKTEGWDGEAWTDS